MNTTTFDWMRERVDEVRAFRAYNELMLDELAANAFKGDREGWREYSPEKCLSEIHHHVAKLHVVSVELARRRRGEEPRELPWPSDLEDLVCEFGADVGNCCMQLLDSLDLLDIPE